MPLVFSFASKVAAAILAIPLAALAAFMPSLFDSRAKLSASEVATCLRDFLRGAGGPWDWDDFTSVSVSDPRLKDIRRRAAAVDLPVTEEGLAILRGLLLEADHLAGLETAT